MNDAEKVNVTILEEWIAGRGKHPVTWETLIATMRDAELNVLAGEIAAVKAAHSKEQFSELQDTRRGADIPLLSDPIVYFSNKCSCSAADVVEYCI